MNFMTFLVVVAQGVWDQSKTKLPLIQPHRFQHILILTTNAWSHPDFEVKLHNGNNPKYHPVSEFSASPGLCRLNQWEIKKAA